ncbi:hypothetical protein C8R43DRAFT_1121639 [Mycena crocata]|nr:hypothetical protein C8R43DRAFT_1121639 [Mycena crocata]
MPPQPQTVSQSRLNNIIQCLAPAIQTLNALVDAFGTPFVQVISNITSELIPAVLNVKKNKEECLVFMEKIYSLLAAIINLHLQSDSGQPGTLPLPMLHHLGKFTESASRSSGSPHVQDGNKLKQFFRQAEIKQLLKDCNSGLQEALDGFKIDSILLDVNVMQKHAHKQHNDLLELIATLSDGTVSDNTSSIGRPFGGSFDSSNSLSMLPSEPKIFHGRDLELQAILESLHHDSELARIAILGAGGMGKTSLARAVLHHPDIASRYARRVFVEADAAATSSELVALIGAHLGLKPGNDLMKPVLHALCSGPPCLLVLYNMETPWEPLASRPGVEEFLSLLANIPQLALIITMRGAERPAKVRWSRPFLPVLTPLPSSAAYQTFIDIADDDHDRKDIDKLLRLTEYAPRPRWEKERTSMLSEGYDRKSSLNASIAVSLSSPRMTSLSGARDLLTLVSILPDGISDTELLQSNVPINDILACKAALLRTSLAYIDPKSQLRALVPIREYMRQEYPPSAPLIQPLTRHFGDLIQFHRKYSGNQLSASTVGRITANLANFQQVFQTGLHAGLHQDNRELEGIIDSILSLNRFCALMGHPRPLVMDDIPRVLAQKKNAKLDVMFITELLHSSSSHPVPDPERLID